MEEPPISRTLDCLAARLLKHLAAFVGLLSVRVRHPDAQEQPSSDRTLDDLVSRCYNTWVGTPPAVRMCEYSLRLRQAHSTQENTKPHNTNTC